MMNKAPTPSTPWHEQSEQVLLSGMLQYPTVIPKIQAALEVDDFFSLKHQTLCRAIFALGEAAADLPAVIGKLKGDNLLQEAGGEQYILSIYDCCSTSAGWEHHAEQVKDAADRRRLIHVCLDAVGQARRPSESLSDTASRIGDAVAGLSSKGRVTPTPKGAPTMADLRQYVDLCLVPGQKTTIDEICRGLSCYHREERKVIYGNIGRLCKEGILCRDDYRHGGYRKAVQIEEYDLAGDLGKEEASFDITLPLRLEGLLKLRPDQLFQVSGRYDAGKSSFLYQVMADNYQDNKIVHIVSDEWSLSAIKERMDVLGIPRPHPNIKVLPMKPGYEETIPSGRCIALIDYIRADQNPFETDAQIQRVLRNLNGGIAMFATQKHPGLDRPVGGQFAVHASHHIILLDRWKGIFTCKIYRSKSEKNLEGLYRTFKIDVRMRLRPVMETWKKGEIKWERPLPNDRNDSNDSKDSD